MNETIDTLYFNWEVNAQNLLETYRPLSDSTFEFNSEMFDYSFVIREYHHEVDFTASDYIFQMQFILNLYVFKNLDEKLSPEMINKAISLLKSAEHIFLKAVNCTKIIFDSICRFEIAFNEMCIQQKNRFESESFERELNSISLKFLKSIPDVGYSFFIRMDLGKAKRDFARIRAPFAISNWIIKMKKLIQKKASQIADEAIPFLNYSLWNDFREYNKNGYDDSLFLNIVERIERFFISHNRAMRILKTMVNGYVVHNNNGCCAICFTDDGKYYSLSGVDDYKDNLSKIKGWIQRKNFQNIIDALSPGNDFKYAYLKDTVMCYGIGWSNAQNQRNYRSNPGTLAIVHNEPNLVRRDISCCERKIMAECPNAHKYEFYIRYDPCDWCRPDLLSKNNKKITFITSEGRSKPLIKLKIKQTKSQGSLPWYDFEKV